MDKDKRNKKDKRLDILIIITIIVQISCFAGLIFLKDRELKHLCIITYFIWENALLSARVNRLEEIEEEGREEEEEK